MIDITQSTHITDIIAITQGQMMDIAQSTHISDIVAIKQF